MRINLPTDLLRSFVMIVDTGSMVKASEHIFLTQSALSLQMKRLSDLIQQPLFRRQKGNLILTEAGERLLVVAREILVLNDDVVGSLGARTLEPIRVGMVQDFAEAILSGVLHRFNQSHPDIRLQIRVANSSDLREMFASDLLDLSLYLGDPDDAASVVTTPIVWLGDPDLLLQPVLPVAIMSKPCRFRDAGLASLDAARRSYDITVETPSVSVLRAVVQSGLAITCRTPAFLGSGYMPLELGLTTLPEIGYAIDVRNGASDAVLELLALTRDALAKL
jgi:DNA-binding transcriptional LysR family regulator